MKIAVLITCFNRKDKTKACLSRLFEQKLPAGSSLTVYICDDASTDGTFQMLKEDFPQVKVVQGDGNLYWGGGMRAAWQLAKSDGSADFYLWLNDDILLFPESLAFLFQEYQSLDKEGILVGACCLPGTSQFSYGGLNESLRPSPPTGRVKEITFMNGNLVLIPANIERKVASIAPEYTHYLGDFDYGLRAQKAGFSCYSTSRFLASCDVNDLPNWADPGLPLQKRWQLVHAVKGLALNEFLYFKSYHSGKWISFKTRIEIYLKVLFPIQYLRVRDLFKGKSSLNPQDMLSAFPSK